MLTFGSESSSEKDKENLISFQRYAGRRVQRFPARSPNCLSFNASGWIRLTPYMCVKKLPFLHTIIGMDERNVVRDVFKATLSKYL